MGTVLAQPMKPVKVTSSFKATSENEGVIIFVATIDNGWHMYSTEEVDGPTPTTLTVEKISGAQLDGKLQHTTAPIKKFEEMFGTDVYYFEKTATFTQKVKLLGGKYVVEGYLKYGACNDNSCTPPTSVDFNVSGEVDPLPKPSPSMGRESSSEDAMSLTEEVQPDSLTNLPLGGESEGEMSEGQRGSWSPA